MEGQPMKIDLLVLHDRFDYRDAETSRYAMKYFLKKELNADIFEPPLERKATVHDARNAAVNAVRDDADFILMCDDDMACDDPYALVKLIRLMEKYQDFGAATPLTVKRKFPIEFASSYLEDYNGNPRSIVLTPSVLEQFDEIVYPALGGGGFLLLRADTLRKAMAAHLKAMDWLFDHEHQLNRMGVGAGRIRQEQKLISDSRHQAYETAKHHTLFYFPFDSYYTYLHGEDWAFTLFLHRLGIRTMVAKHIHVLHLGVFGYSPSMLGIRHWAEVEVSEEEKERQPDSPPGMDAALEPAPTE